jgi:uncharacterized protein
MIKNSWLVAIVVFLVLAVVVYTFTGGGNDQAYINAIEKERDEKNRFMKFNKESPIPVEFKDSFNSLEYFPVDAKYKVKARLEPINENKLLVLPTNDGSEERYIKFAYAHFILDGKQQKLLILEPMIRQFRTRLFLIFTDETSGEESYGAARYLDLQRESDQSITIDFNKAYNPYCAYNEGFSCPLPPAGNHISVPIKAGEKDFLMP